MQPSFWHDRWQNKQIGFHEPDTNPLLLAHFSALALPTDSRIFLPLCGKTRDIAWLLAQGLRVVGVELSDIAVRELFDELALEPSISQVGALKLYRAPQLDVFVGDIFALEADALGAVDAVYDRAALIALPPDMRRRYTTHLLAATGAAPQLVICLEYDQKQMDGPPFNVSVDEVHEHYAAVYHVHSLTVQEVVGGLKGRTPATERVWLLRRPIDK